MWAGSQSLSRQIYRCIIDFIFLNIHTSVNFFAKSPADNVTAKLPIEQLKGRMNRYSNLFKYVKSVRNNIDDIENLAKENRGKRICLSVSETVVVVVASSSCEKKSNYYLGISWCATYKWKSRKGYKSGRGAVQKAGKSGIFRAATWDLSGSLSSR